jgi:hypothetical protein
MLVKIFLLVLIAGTMINLPAKYRRCPLPQIGCLLIFLRSHSNPGPSTLDYNIGDDSIGS